MNFFEEIRRWNKERNAIRLLNAMSDRQLRDIGLVRGEIKPRVRGKTL